MKPCALPPSPARANRLAAWLSLPCLLFTAEVALARVTCQLQHATQATNPFVITSWVFPFGDVVYTQTSLNVSCQRDDNRAFVDIEIGASNRKGGTSPRVAILTTNTYWGIGYALTHGGGCASNAASSNWFAYGSGTSYTYKARLVFNGSMATLDVPACLTVGHGNNVAYQAGSYRDKVIFTLAYQEWTSMPAVTTTLDMDYRVEVAAGCRVSQNPANLALVYTALSATDLNASTTLGLTCNPELPWSASLDATSGMASPLGLPYQLSLSTSQGVGVGYQQGIAITATIPRGLAGVCPSSQCQQATPSRYTLTITY